MAEFKYPFSVLGSGSWGTALAVLLARNGQPVLLWGNEPDQVARLKSERCNAQFIPDVQFPDPLELSDNLAQTIKESRDVLIVVPSEAFRTVLQAISPHIHKDTRIAWGTKGFEPGTGKLLHEVLQEVLGQQVTYAVLSGPTFAHEVARGLPTAITTATDNTEFASDIVALLGSDCFRVYTTKDVVGVEVSGAVKNVLAIAAGIADGLGFGANARAALVTRGLVELMRLGVALGGQRETFMGLAGLGDLVLTCTDNQSRNRRLGLALGEGKSLQEALVTIKQVAEGVQTAREVVNLAKQKDIEMPITTQVYRVLYEGHHPQDAVNELFSREQKTEKF